MKQELAYNELIIVPGHAVFKDEVKTTPKDFVNDDWWILQPFQAREPKFYVEHIFAGLHLASENPKSILIFSGGFTRKEANVWSEATTYETIARSKCDNCNEHCTVPNRIVLDEGSYDSQQNLENSLRIFNEITSNDPDAIKVVGWKFKEERFDFYRKKIGISGNNFSYCGVNNPEDLEAAIRNEKRVLELLKNSDQTKELAEKRNDRNHLNLSCEKQWRFSGRMDLNNLLANRATV